MQMALAKLVSSSCRYDTSLMALLTYNPQVHVQLYHGAIMVSVFFNFIIIIMMMAYKKTHTQGRGAPVVYSMGL
jgi:hypothetical protein